MIWIFVGTKHMELNVLPHAKLLTSSSRSVSGAALKSNNKANQTATQTVNVVIPKQSGDDEPSVSISVQQPAIEVEAEAESTNKPVVNDNPIAIINFLRLVLESYINNPIKYNGLIICSVDLLKQLIGTLTDCDEVTVELADPHVECCKASKIQAINKIWVRNGDSNEVFKYKYSNLLQVFESYKISLKFVYIDI